MYPQEESNKVKSFISSSFGDDKLSKSKELTHFQQQKLVECSTTFSAGSSPIRCMESVSA